MIAARLARPADLPAIADITERAYAPYEAVLGGKPLPMTEDYGPRVARGEVWLIDRDRQAAGLMVVERAADHLMIFSLAALPEAQHQGIGRWMLRHAETLARHSGLPALRLYTNTRMARNIALYRQYGFQDAGQRPHPHRTGWMIQDMEMKLG